MVSVKNPVTVVLEVGMHCDSCASQIMECARLLKGVETVTVDMDKNRLTIVGHEVDPLQIKEDLGQKIKKKFDIVSPCQHKSGGTTVMADNSNCNKKFNEEKQNFDNATDKDEDVNTGKNNEQKPDQKGQDVANKPQEECQTTIVLKLEHYCQGCSSKIRKAVLDTTGVQKMAVDEQKELITVKGTMNAKTLMENLQEKLSRPVQILSVTKEELRKGDENDGKKKNVSDDAKRKDSTMELKAEETQATIAVFKVPLHCDGCTAKIRKIVYRIRGVHEVKINKAEETVTVIATTDVKTLTETMRKRLKKVVVEQKIEVKKEEKVIEEPYQYVSDKKAPKQETTSQPALEISVQHSEIIQITVHQIDEVRSQSQTPDISSDSRAKLDSEVEEYYLSESESSAWAFLITSICLEGVSAALDQFGHLFCGMVLAIMALLLSIFELIYMARRERVITFNQRSDIPCFHCHPTSEVPASQVFSIVHCFGFTCAVWQCLYSTMQYIYAHRHLDNPIRTTLLPFIFLLCVLISKLIRKLEESNCQNPKSEIAKSQSQSYTSQLRDTNLSSKGLKYEDQGYAFDYWTQQNAPNSQRNDTEAHDVQTAGDPADTTSFPPTQSLQRVDSTEADIHKALTWVHGILDIER